MLMNPEFSIEEFLELIMTTSLPAGARPAAPEFIEEHTVLMSGDRNKGKVPVFFVPASFLLFTLHS